MSSSNKKWKFKNIFTSKTTCGCGPNETDIIEPELKPRTSSTSSSSILPQNEELTKWHCLRNSLAVVKDSNDPYEDFRKSMVEMIIEKEIYSRNDLQQLLQCFLELNSPQHHKLIVRAFMEIWNGTDEAPCLAGN